MPHRPCRKLHAQGRSFGAVLFLLPNVRCGLRPFAGGKENEGMRCVERRTPFRCRGISARTAREACAEEGWRRIRRNGPAARGRRGRAVRRKQRMFRYLQRCGCGVRAAALSQVAAAVRSGRAVSAARLCGRARRRAASVALCAERGRRETRGRRGMRAQASSRSAVHAQCRLEAVAELALFAGGDVDAPQFQLPAQLPQPAFQAGRHVASQRALERGHV